MTSKTGTSQIVKFSKDNSNKCYNMVKGKEVQLPQQSVSHSVWKAQLEQYKGEKEIIILILWGQNMGILPPYAEV